MNERGFTLIEVMTAMAILSIGILAVANMQIQAIRGNGLANTMSGANAVAVSFLEELKRLEFDDALLADNDNNGLAGLDDGTGTPPTPSNADHEFVAADFPLFADSYALVGGVLVDNAGIKYQIFWNVDRSRPTWVPATSETPYCLIRLHVYWESGFGPHSLEKTTFKYNNITL